MEEDILGFVTGNNNRQKLLALLGSKGGMDAARIAKTMRIVRPSVNRILEELVERELITRDGEIYSLSDLGVQVEKKIHSF